MLARALPSEIFRYVSFRHLKILRERGLVNATRQGVSIQYELADPRLIQALDLLRSVLRESLARRANLMEEIQAE